MTLTFMTAFMGLDTTRTMVYQIFSLLFSIVLLSFLWSFFFRSHLSATRILPDLGTAGQPFEYRVRFHNRSSRPQKGLLMFENIEDPRPTEEEFLHTSEPGEKKRNVYDRTLLVYRWFWLTSLKRMINVEEKAIPDILPHEEGEVRINVTPRRRGYLRLTGLTIARPDPFNLLKSYAQLPVKDSVLILPKRYEVPPIQLPGTRKFKLGGVSLASSVGESEEFISLRDYRPGDPLRHIHWRSWAKTGKPIVKEYQDEYFVRHALVLDTFQASAFSDVFEEAVSVAASLAYTVRTQDSLLDLMFVGTKAYCFTIGRGLAHTRHILEILASVTPCMNKPFNVLPPVVAERSSLLSGCICIFLDWDDERKHFVGYLQSLGVPVLVFVVTDGKTGTSLEREEFSENFHKLEVGKIQEGLAKIGRFS